MHNGLVTSQGSGGLPWSSTLAGASVGALGAFGIAGLATIGLFLLAGAALVAAVALAVPRCGRRRVPGFLVGLSTAPLYIAWLNRGGPGLVCTTTADSMSCSDQWSPWPFVALGVLFAGAGLALLRREPPAALTSSPRALPRRPAGRPRT